MVLWFKRVMDLTQNSYGNTKSGSDSGVQRHDSTSAPAKRRLGFFFVSIFCFLF